MNESRPPVIPRKLVERGSWRRSRSRLLDGALGRNTTWMTIGMGCRLLIQALTVLLIARRLGAHEFGLWAASLAIVSIVAPFSALGTGNVLIMRIATEQSSFEVVWGNALLVVVGGCLIGTVVVLAVGAIVVPELPRHLLAVIAVTELLCYQLVTVSGQAFQAFERLGQTAAVQLLPGLFRLAAALLFVTIGHDPSAAAWSRWYIAATAIAASVAVRRATVALGRPQPDLRTLRGGVREGAYFALGTASLTVSNDLDKAILARLSSFDAAGVYAAGYRLVQMSSTPIRALLSAAYPSFFVRGRSGIRGSVAVARRLVPMAFAYSGAASTLIFGLAGAVPLLLGRQYAEVAEVLRWLAPLPMLQSLHYFASDTLTGAGFQRARSSVQIGVVGLNAALNLLLVPRFSWHGAAWATLASDAVLAIGLWTVVFMIARSERRPG